jgi:hypothetical protein
LAYADRFARPPTGQRGVQVITTDRGLLSADVPVGSRELREFGTGDIRANHPGYREPLARDLAQLSRAADADVVLLGSVATSKYVDVLLEFLGERLLFPREFVGRGDMSRGALLLRAARSGEELSYQPVSGAVRHGPRAARLDSR